MTSYTNNITNISKIRLDTHEVVEFTLLINFIRVRLSPLHTRKLHKLNKRFFRQVTVTFNTFLVQCKCQHSCAVPFRVDYVQ